MQNEISDKRWQRFENSFAKEVEDFYHKLGNGEREISKFVPPTLNLKKDEFYLEYHTEYLTLHQRLSAKLINSLIDEIEAKRENPSTKISMDSKLFDRTLNEIEEILKQVNILIEKNNNATKEFYKELQNAAHSLEKYFVLRKVHLKALRQVDIPARENGGNQKRAKV